jgi:hypothetical protein
MHDDRSAIAHAAAGALHRAGTDGTLAATPALAGFDGFIDSIIRVVDRRRSMRMDDFDAIGAIPGFAGRVAAAAGKSANIELVVEEDRFGGNGPLYAGALGRLGMPTTYLGAVGKDDASRELLPIYEPFAARCEEVVPLAAPAHTDALEFEDGKIMLGKTAPVQAVTWERLVERVGLDGLRARCARSRLIGIVNWTLCGGVQGIWEGLIDHVLPTLGEQGGQGAGPKVPRHEGMERRRRVFIDLSDPAKRTDADLLSALEVLRRMDDLVPVTLGLNLAESERVARVLGVEAHADAPSLGESLRGGAERIRARSGLACIVIHPREGGRRRPARRRQRVVRRPLHRPTPPLDRRGRPLRGRVQLRPGAGVAARAVPRRRVRRQRGVCAGRRIARSRSPDRVPPGPAQGREVTTPRGRGPVPVQGVAPYTPP